MSPGLPAALLRARIVAGTLAAGMLVLAAVLTQIDLGGNVSSLTLPAGLFGLVGPVIAYRLYYYRSDQAISARLQDDGAAFLQAQILALAIAEAPGFFGCIVYALSREPMALTGVLTFVIFVGATWPSTERVDAFYGR